ncbi:MAG: hypothetical protein GXZ02_04765 [Clostridiales bacterium]|nr:hypothetical protein [Clostridiales bacterium]
MSRIEEYVARSFKDIPDSDRKEQLRQEIVQNLNEKVFDLMEQGKTQEDAENKAMADFGDFDDIKQELGTGPAGENPTDNKNYFLRLWFSVFGSALIIALMIFINFYYGEQPVWFVYPAFGVLWWPLAMTFQWLKHRR